MLQNHNLWPEWFLAIKLDGEGERGREGGDRQRERERERERERGERERRERREGERQTDRQFQKVSLPPLQHEASVVDKTIQKKRWHKGLQEKCMYQPITGQDPGSLWQQRRGVPGRKHKTGTTVLVLMSHLPSASSKPTDLTDQASFPSTDTVITTKKSCPDGCWTKSSTRACVSSARRRSKSCERVVRHFLVGAAGCACSRDHALAWPCASVTTRTRESSPRRHFVSPCACSGIPHLSTFTWNGPLCAVLV